MEELLELGGKKGMEGLGIVRRRLEQEKEGQFEGELRRVKKPANQCLK